MMVSETQIGGDDDDREWFAVLRLVLFLSEDNRTT
jgi:hypothetical protein